MDQKNIPQNRKVAIWLRRTKNSFTVAYILTGGGLLWALINILAGNPPIPALAVIVAALAWTDVALHKTALKKALEESKRTENLEDREKRQKRA